MLRCSRRSVQCSVSYALVRTNTINVSRCFPIISRLRRLIDQSSLPEGWTKPRTWLLHWASSQLLARHMMTVFHPCPGALVPSVIEQLAAYTTSLSLLHHPYHCWQSRKTLLTSVPLCRTRSDIKCHSFFSLCIRTFSSAHRRPAVLTCTSFISIQLTLLFFYRDQHCYLFSPVANSTGPRQTLAELLLSPSGNGPFRRSNASAQRTR